jgi:hypothetical protein
MARDSAGEHARCKLVGPRAEQEAMLHSEGEQEEPGVLRGRCEDVFGLKQPQEHRRPNLPPRKLVRECRRPNLWLCQEKVDV